MRADICVHARGAALSLRRLRLSDPAAPHVLSMLPARAPAREALQQAPSRLFFFFHPYQPCQCGCRAERALSFLVVGALA